MIKGVRLKPRTYDFRFTDAFIDFLHLVDSAAVTYKREVVTVDDKEQSDPEIRFNLSSSLEKYRTSLANSFSGACDEIEQAINDTYQKTEKLYLLTRYIVEVEALETMLRKDNGSYHHIRFSFTNLSEGDFAQDNLKEDAFQEYYYWMELYISKCKSFLQSIKHTVEITRQEDFPVPSSLLPDPNASSVENPIAFFEYIFAKNGIAALRRAFIPTEEDEYHYDVSYDKETETKTVWDYDPETGEPETMVYKFQDKLYSRCFSEFNTTKSLIDERVLKAGRREEIELFIEVLINRIKYLIEYIKRNKDAQKYPELHKFPDALIRYFYNKYNSFCPKVLEADGVIAGIISNTSTSPQLAAPTLPELPAPYNPGVFRWAKGEPSRLSGILYSYLNKQLISDTDTDIFLRAFSGGPSEKPLGIRWIDKPKNGSGVNKVTLLYLFKGLCENGLIDLDFNSPELLQKIEFVFADAEGKKLDYLDQSKANVNKGKGKTLAKTIIDRAITAMLS